MERMRWMKKYVRPFVALVLVLCLCVSLAGCSMELTDMLMLKQAYQHVKGWETWEEVPKNWREKMKIVFHEYSEQL